MRFLILGRSVGLKKKKPKKNHKKSRNSRPWYPRTTLKVNIHIFGLTKCTICCEKCSCFCSCFSLLCFFSFFREKELFQVKNGVTTSFLFFFFKCQKFGSVGRRWTGEKKEDELTSIFSRKILFRDRSLSEMMTLKFRVQNEMNQIIKWGI